MKASYKKRDEARELYDQGLNIKQVEKIVGIKCTYYIIPKWKRDLRQAKEIAQKKREAKNLKIAEAHRRRYEKRVALEVRERSRKLRKSEIKRIKAISKQIQTENVVKRAKTINQCPVNDFLLRRW